METASPMDENDRRVDLASYGVLDSEPDTRYDDITLLASQICATPIALISLGDENRQFVKARISLPAEQIPDATSFCAHAIRNDGVLVVPDARQDSRFRFNPLVSREPHIIAYAGAPLRNPEGYYLGTLCVFDFRPREFATDQILSLEALGRQVMHLLEMRRYIERLKDEIEKRKSAEAVKAAFLARMSHGIRTPLSVILGYNERLYEMSAQERSSKEVDRMLKAAYRSSRGLQTLVNDFVDFGSLENPFAKITLREAPFDPADILETIMGMFDLVARNKGIHLNYRVEGDLPPLLQGDEGRMTQILVNLVSNAVKVTEEGTVTLGLIVAERTSDGALIEFFVNDTGPGISPQVRKAILAERKSSGSFGMPRVVPGLGLIIVRELVALMGGELTLDPGEGGGSRLSFRLCLPTPRNSDGLDELGRPGQKLPERLRILLVEDNEDNRDLLLYYFKNRSWVVDYAANGALGLEKFRSNRYDLVLMDMQMPIMDGFAATRAIREMERIENRKAVPLAGFTAYGLPEEIERCMNVGCDIVITKPVFKSELLQRLDSLLNVQ